MPQGQASRSPKGASPGPLDASGYPADTVSLRSVSSDNFVIQDITREPKIVAEVDFDSVRHGRIDPRHMIPSEIRHDCRRTDREHQETAS